MCVCLCGEGGARLSRRNAQTQVCSALATPMSLAQFSIEIWFELRVPFVKEKKKTRDEFILRRPAAGSFGKCLLLLWCGFL